MLVAIVLVVGAVGLFLALGGSGKKKDDTPTPQPISNQPAKPVKPAVPAPPAYPRIDNALKKKGDELIKEMKPLYDEAEALYNEALEIKNQDRSEYQRLLSESNDQLSKVRELYSQIEEMMPENTAYGRDAVADYYFGRDFAKVGKVDELAAAVRKQITVK